MADTTTTTTFCSFPKRFSSDEDGFLFYMNRLLKNAKLELVGIDGDYGMECSSVVDGQTYELPLNFNHGGCPDEFVQFLQDLLDLNGHRDLHVILDHQHSFEFEILTKEELLARLPYPQEEFRYDGGLIHPKVCYTWAWVSEKTGKLFTCGEVSDFPKDSDAYVGAFGPYEPPKCPKSVGRCVSPDPSVARSSKPFVCGSCE